MERYHPDVLTEGAGEHAYLMFVISPKGDVVRHQRGRFASPADTVETVMRVEAGPAVHFTPRPDFDVDLSATPRIHVIRTRPGAIGRDPLTIFWLREGIAGELVAATGRDVIAHESAIIERFGDGGVIVSGGASVQAGAIREARRADRP